jgi:hypothetical protein
MRMAKPNKIGKSGWLKNDNPPGNPSNAPRCGAKTRRQTLPSSGHAKRSLPNARRRQHGSAHSEGTSAIQESKLENTATIRLKPKRRGCCSANCYIIVESFCRGTDSAISQRSALYKT